LFRQGNVGRSEGEGDENRGDMGALGAVAGFVVVAAATALHGDGVVIAEILHFELGFDAGGVDARWLEQGANRHAGRFSTRTGAGRLSGEGGLRYEPREDLER